MEEGEDEALRLVTAGKMRDELKKLVAKGMESIEKEIAHAGQAIDKVHSRRCSEKFADLLPALRVRKAVLERVKRDTTQEFSEYVQSTKALAETISPEDSSVDVAAKQLPLPLRIFNMLASKIQVEDAIKRLGSAGAIEELTRDKKKISAELLGSWKHLCSSSSNISKHIEDTLSKDDQAIVRRCSGGAIKAATAAKAGATYARIFSVDLSTISRHVQISTGDGDSKHDVDAMSEPWVIRNSSVAKALMEDGQIRLNHLVFKAAFSRDKQAKRDVKELVSAAPSRTKLLEALLTKQALDSVACDDAASGKLTEGHVFGQKPETRNYGPDLYGVGGFKCFGDRSGSMVVIMFEFTKASSTISSQSNSKGATVAQVVQLIRNLDRAGVDKLSFPLYHATVGSGDVLYTPPGWIMLEASLNGLVHGIHFSMLPYTRQNFSNFCSLTKIPAHSPSHCSFGRGCLSDSQGHPTLRGDP